MQLSEMPVEGRMPVIYTESLIRGVEVGDTGKAQELINIRLARILNNARLSKSLRTELAEDEDFKQDVALATLEAAHSARLKKTGEIDVTCFASRLHDFLVSSSGDAWFVSHKEKSSEPESGITPEPMDPVELIAAIDGQRPSLGQSVEEEAFGNARIEALNRALAALPENERELIMARYGYTGIYEHEIRPLTLDELGNNAGTNRDKVRQKEAKILSKLQSSTVSSYAIWKHLLTICGADANMGLEELSVDERRLQEDKKHKAEKVLAGDMQRRHRLMEKRLFNMPGYRDKKLISDIAAAMGRIIRLDRYVRNAETFMPKMWVLSELGHQRVKAKGELTLLLAIKEKRASEEIDFASQ